MSLAILGALPIGLAGAAAAQNQVEAPPETGPGAELRRNLTTLAANPESVVALIGAGRASLAMGDYEAAFGFFDRAREADPGSARALAGMASALVHLERPAEAIPLFERAVALGAPEAEIAADRGLAYDSIGDPRRAQADYALSLRHNDDPEIRRRMALSLAISGQREAALRMIDGQIRNQDRAAWRTQAFVLALTGDPAGAERIARNVMLPGGAEQMAPFFHRLASLSPAQKAMAVHFGSFPHDGRTTYAAPPPRAEIAAADPPAAEPPRPRARPAEPIERRDERVATLIPRRERFAPPVTPPRREPEPEPEPAGFSLAPQGPQPQAEEPPSQPPSPAPEPARSRLDGVADVVAALPADEPRTAPVRTARVEEQRPPARTERRPAAARPGPTRIWVQLAHASRAGVLASEFAEVRAKAPALLNSRAPHVTLANRSNLLLVGPFDTRAAAQAFVRRLAERDVTALVWTSPAGQEIERLRIPNAPATRTSRTEASERTTARASRSRPEPKQRPSARGRRTR